MLRNLSVEYKYHNLGGIIMFIINLILMIITIFASFKLAQEKGQSTIIWPLATAFIGVLVFIVQYLMSVYMPSNKPLI